MASSSETGHAKNVANFFLLIQELKNFGAKYNPSNADLSIAKLETQYTAAEAAQQSLNTALPSFNTSTNARHLAFKSLGSIVTRSLGMLRASGATPAKVKNAEQWAKKVRGMSKAKSADADPNAPTVSTSQQSYDLKIDLFDKYLAELESEPKYSPNEAELTIVSLRQLHQDMDTANKAIKIAAPIIFSARNARNIALYDEPNGVVAVSKYIKEYVKALYGFTHANYRKVSGISIRNLKG